MPTILVADDNSNIQKMVTLALKEQGINVVAVGNGEAAVRKLPDVQPDLVLADIFMPVRNGYEVCEFVKQDQRFAHIPVVLLVGAFDPLDEHEVERVHADGVLKKPFVPPDPLIALVRTLLERGAQAQPAGATFAPAVVPEAQSPAAFPHVAAVLGTQAPPATEKTQKLTPEEIASLTGAGKPASPPPPTTPAPEPEVEQFGTQPPSMAIEEGHAPVAFRELLEEEGGEGEEEEKEPEAEEELEETPQEPAFEASSLSDIEFPGEFEAKAADVPEAHEVAPEPGKGEADWGGIKEELKQPTPEEPPIKVEFGPPEHVEIIRDDETTESGIQVAPSPDLVSSSSDWVSSPSTPPVVAPESGLEPESPLWSVPPEPPPLPAARAEEREDFEPFVVEAESRPVGPSRGPFAPAPERVEEKPREEAVKASTAAPDLEETQRFVVSPKRTEAPLPSPAPPAEPLEEKPAVEKILEEVLPAALAAGGIFTAGTAPPHAEPAARAEEGWPLVLGAGEPPPPPKPQQTWGRMDEVSLPAPLHERESLAAAPPAPVHEPEPVPLVAVPPPSAAGQDLLIALITEKVLKQIDPGVIERISREVVRPLVEALIRRELGK